jgi:hypothetical protein
MEVSQAFVEGGGNARWSPGRAIGAARVTRMRDVAAAHHVLRDDHARAMKLVEGERGVEILADSRIR